MFCLLMVKKSPMLGNYGLSVCVFFLLALPTKAKDIVFSFIIEYSGLRDFGP